MRVLSANLIHLTAKLLLLKFTICVTLQKLIFLHSNAALVRKK